MKRTSFFSAALFAMIVSSGVTAQNPANPPAVACASCGVVTSVR